MGRSSVLFLTCQLLCRSINAKCFNQQVVIGECLRTLLIPFAFGGIVTKLLHPRPERIGLTTICRIRLNIDIGEPSFQCRHSQRHYGCKGFAELMQVDNDGFDTIRKFSALFNATRGSQPRFS
jgi:hypothetical protein